MSRSASLPATAPRRAVLLLRRPLLFVFVIGCGVAAMAAGRFTPRLIVDGAASFAFVPLFHILALRVTFRPGARSQPSFARAVDLFFAGSGPWLVSFVVVTAIVAVVPPRRIGPWLLPILGSALIPLVWSLWIDFHFFRDVMQRSGLQAVRDLVVQRTVAWIGIAAYFAGPSIADDPLPAIRQWLSGL